MANVIDALVMTLGLDAKDYNKQSKRVEADMGKLRKSSDKTAKEMAAQGKHAAQFYRSIKVELLGLLATFGAATGVKSFISTMTTGQAELGRLSKNLGISGKNLEAWGTIAKEMGDKASTAYGALQSVAGGLAEARIKRHSQLTDMARANGVNLEGVKDSEEVLMRISARMKQLPRQQAIWLASHLGVGGISNELLLGPKALKKRIDHLRTLSKTTEKSRENAQRLQKEWADFGLRIKGVEENIFSKLSPALLQLGDRFSKWLDSVDWDKAIKKTEDFAGQVNHVVKQLGGWKRVAEVLGGVLAVKLLSPLTSLVAGFGRLIPLLLSTKAGLLGISAAAGSVAGTWIFKHGVEGSKLGRAIGSSTATALALMGNKTAQGADIRTYWSKFSDAQKKRLVQSYLGASAERKKGMEKGAPESVRLYKMYISTHYPRGVRNNNPLNLNYAGQAGAHLEPGSNARAAARQLRLYAQRGNDTVAGIVRKWAPKADGNNVKAYIATVMRSLKNTRYGENAHQHLPIKSNPQILALLIRAMATAEGNGSAITNAQILRGVGVGPRQKLMASGAMHNSHNRSTSETHIGKIEVNTKATDGAAIVRDMYASLQTHPFALSADTGVS